jgi:hypothetical protein
LGALNLTNRKIGGTGQKALSMKVTAETITDAQIHELLRTRLTGDLKRDAMYRRALDRTHVNRARDRERCAEIWNACHADAAKREAAQIEAAATGKPIDPRLAAAAVPKTIEVKLTHNDAWVVLLALAAYDARDEKVPDAKTWIAERLLRLVQP